jgi:hypothetical protein
VRKSDGIVSDWQSHRRGGGGRQGTLKTPLAHRARVLGEGLHP